MPVIHTGDGKFISVDRLKCVNAKRNAGEKLRYGVLNGDFPFYLFSGFLRVLKVFPGTGNKLFENAVLQFKAHRPVIMNFRSQSFNKIGIIVVWMELDKFYLRFLLIGEERVIVKVSVADNIRSDFLCKVRLAGAGRTTENQIF